MIIIVSFIQKNEKENQFLSLSKSPLIKNVVIIARKHKTRENTSKKPIIDKIKQQTEA